MWILADLAIKEITTVLLLHPQIIFVCFLLLLSAGSLRLVSTELLVSLGEKAPGIYSSVAICLQLGPSSSAKFL